MLMIDHEISLFERIVFEIEDTNNTPLLIFCDDLDVLVQGSTLASVKKNHRSGEDECYVHQL